MRDVVFSRLCGMPCAVAHQNPAVQSAKNVEN